jgi:hypothetical protein
MGAGVGNNSRDEAVASPGRKHALTAALVPVPAVLLGLGVLANPAVAALPIVAVDNHYQTPESTTLSGVNVLGNDIINVNGIPQVIAFTAAQHGVNSIMKDGVLTYTPTTGYLGPDQFSYTADIFGKVGQSSATVFINVVPPVQPVPALEPLALGGLAALVAWFGLRRKSD